MFDQRIRRTLAAGVAVLAATSVLAGCGSANSSKTVVVATHDSWAMPKGVIKAFEKRTGYTVKIEEQGDAGELTNKLVLTKNEPVADAVYGIDNTFATRAVNAGVLAPYRSKAEPTFAKRFQLSGKGAHELTPVDYGDVCVNVDNSWFAKHHKPEPKNLDDLTKPAWRNLFVVPGATTSSPGLAFLAATIAAKGSHWQQYWKALLANGVKIDSGWDQAWSSDYTAGGGKGTRPIVLSYSSSPPDTIPHGAKRPTTGVLLDTCFRQVEYAGVLEGAANPAGAKAFVDFMESHAVQTAMPGSMYMYPVDKSVKLPADWARWAPVAKHPWYIPPAELTAKRSTWLSQWRNLVSQ